MTFGVAVVCGHVSGLFARSRLLALMQFAAWLPISFSRLEVLHSKRVLPSPGFDRFAIRPELTERRSNTHKKFLNFISD